MSRLSQAISEGDGISVIASVADVESARAAEDDGAEAIAITSRVPGLREATSLPILWVGPAAPEDADACLLPGDPLRAKYIAETYLEDVTQRNSERGLLGYTGTWEGKPVSVQGTGIGCPGATIVFEELIQLGVKKLLRVGTCGGLQPHHALGDMIVALSAVPQDGTTNTYVREPHAPTADWGPTESSSQQDPGEVRLQVRSQADSE